MFCAFGAKPACAARAFQIKSFNLKVVLIRKIYAATEKERSNPRFPFLLLEPHQHEAVAHEERALDEHPVGREQLKLLRLAHGRELVLEVQLLKKFLLSME